MRALSAGLQMERNVRLAVLFGSAATGEDTSESDIDLLVALRDDDISHLAGLRRRLAQGFERPLHLVLLEDAEKTPALLADVLSEGRVVLDRDGLWKSLLADGDDIRRRAAEDDARLIAQAASSVAASRARITP